MRLHSFRHTSPGHRISPGHRSPAGHRPYHGSPASRMDRLLPGWIVDDPLSQLAPNSDDGLMDLDSSIADSAECHAAISLHNERMTRWLGDIEISRVLRLNVPSNAPSAYQIKVQVTLAQVGVLCSQVPLLRLPLAQAAPLYSSIPIYTHLYSSIPIYIHPWLSSRLGYRRELAISPHALS